MLCFDDDLVRVISNKQTASITINNISSGNRFCSSDLKKIFKIISDKVKIFFGRILLYSYFCTPNYEMIS